MVGRNHIKRTRQFKCVREAESQLCKATIVNSIHPMNQSTESSSDRPKIKEENRICRGAALFHISQNTYRLNTSPERVSLRPANETEPRRVSLEIIYSLPEILPQQLRRFVSFSHHLPNPPGLPTIHKALLHTWPCNGQLFLGSSFFLLWRLKNELT